MQEEESTADIFELNATVKPVAMEQKIASTPPEEINFLVLNVKSGTNQVISKYSLDLLQKMHRQSADFSQHYKILYQCDAEGIQI
jgi:hypothetical protein